MKLVELLDKITPLPYRVSDTSIVSDDICIAVIEDDGGYEAPAEQRDANAAYLVHASLPAMCGIGEDYGRINQTRTPLTQPQRWKCWRNVRTREPWPSTTTKMGSGALLLSSRLF